MEGVPGTAKTLLVRTLAARAVGRHPAGAVHARPDARRHHRLDGDRQPAGGRADLPRGPGLHQPAARRRDQPDAAQDPVRAAGGDGGGPGLGRRRLPQAALAVPGGRHPEPGRVRRHLPAARGPARPVPAQGGAADPRARPTSWRSCAGTRPASTRATSAAPGVTAVAGAGRHRRRRRPRSRRSRSPPRWSATSSTSPGPPAQSPSLSLGRQPARRHRAAALGPGLGLAHRPRLRHARRRQGARARDASCTGSGCAPRPSSRASTWPRCWPPRSARCRSPASALSFSHRTSYC